MPLVAARPQQKPPRQPKQQQPQQAPSQSAQAFNQLHPRGRGGKWILKPGAGTVPGQPDETTAQLQQRLQQLGFKVQVNGKYDANTQAAVASFQTRYGLDAHGGIDAATLEVLQNPPDQTLAQVQKAQGLNPQGKKITTSAKKASSAKSKSKTSASTGKGTGGAQTASQKATAASKLTVQALGGGTGTLKSGTGMTGGANAQVRSLQTDLGNVGYKVTVDGRFGPQTTAAVKKLQTEHGLPATGNVDPATKGLLAGLAAGAASKTTTSSKSQSAALKAATTAAAKSASAAARAAQPAQLATKTGKASKGGKKTMKLTPPKKAQATLKYHAEQPTDPPDLEETVTELREDTLVNGTGSQKSMAIRDSRDTLPEDAKPIWTTTGWRELPDYTIQDSRGGSGQLPEGAPDVMIPDSRNTVALLEQAVRDRKAATNGREFTRARARERVLRARLEEIGYEESLHPRGRGGEWVGKPGSKVKAALRAGGRHGPLAGREGEFRPGDEVLFSHKDTNYATTRGTLKKINKSGSVRVTINHGTRDDPQLFDHTFSAKGRLMMGRVDRMSAEFTPDTLKNMKKGDTLVHPGTGAYITKRSDNGFSVIGHRGKTKGFPFAEEAHAWASETPPPALHEGLWSESLHPRGRGGKFANVLSKLSGKKGGSGHPMAGEHFVDRSGKEYRIRAPKPPGGSMGFAPGAQLKPGEKDPRIWSSTWPESSTPKIRAPAMSSEEVTRSYEGFSHPAASKPSAPSAPKIRAAPPAQPERPSVGHDKFGVELKKGDRVLMPEPYGGSKEAFITGTHEATGRVSVSPGNYPGVSLQHPDSALEHIPGAGQRWTSSSRPVARKKK